MNVVIKGSPWTERDLKCLFKDELSYVIDADDLSKLAVIVKAYKSTSEARRAGRVGPIPTGFTEWKASKKVRVWIWNPSE